MHTTTPINDEQLDIVSGPSVNISITLRQLELISRKIKGGKAFTPVEEAELNSISKMITDTIEDPGAAGTLHGFAL